MVDTITINQEEENPSVEEQAKAQDNQETQTPKASETSEQRPEWLPEKFSNAEELAKAYGALEQKMSKSTEEKTVEDKPTTTDELKINKQEAEKATGFKLDSYYEEYAKDGSLSDKSYKDLENLGLDKQLVDSYIAGQSALADKHVNSVHAVVGGAENYNNIVQWASENLSENEVKAFNDTMDNGSLDQAQLAISGIQAKYNSANNEPNLLSGQKNDSSVGAYRSIGEMLADINNPKYKDDSAFREDVAQKIKASNVI